MGILDRLSPTAQFIEVIEWLDDSSDTMLYRFLVRDQEIKTGAQLMMRDTDFGMVRLRAFGIYSMRVADPRELIKQIAGTNARFVTEDIEGQLRRTLVSGFSDALGESKIAALDLASNYDELGQFARNKLQDEFKSLGLELTKFFVENISLPPEVEAAMDKRTSLGVIGDVGRYAQFQAADAMRDAAQNTSGGAGMGAGLGAGFAIGNQMMGQMANSMNQPQQQQSGGGGGVGAATIK